VKARWWLVAAVVAAGAARSSCRCGGDSHEPLRIATFNIEDFPKDDRQVAGAFAQIVATGASIVALQEIVETHRFERALAERLGADWQVAFEPSPRHPNHHLGVLFERTRWSLVGLTVHDGTRLEEGRNKPTLEVRLRSAGDGEIVRVLVVHLKAGGDGRAIRARQYTALAQIAETAQASGERVVLLGDFNATDDDGDRGDLAALATKSGLVWASEPLACSAFWDRDDGCFRSRLDHVLAWARPARIEAAGACATDGCDWQDSCPLYRDEVSDHCPVVATFE
jgi:endonuclease/exonuclease/phosphatase family metal-dependent hydrolase